MENFYKVESTNSLPFKTGTKAQYGKSGLADKLVKHNKARLAKKGGLHQ